MSAWLMHYLPAQAAIAKTHHVGSQLPSKQQTRAHLRVQTRAHLKSELAKFCLRMLALHTRAPLLEAVQHFNRPCKKHGHCNVVDFGGFCMVLRRKA